MTLIKIVGDVTDAEDAYDLMGLYFAKVLSGGIGVPQEQRVAALRLAEWLYANAMSREEAIEFADFTGCKFTTPPRPENPPPRPSPFSGDDDEVPF
jgi:hypothetical protein